jgi:hypothetical protein
MSLSCASRQPARSKWPMNASTTSNTTPKHPNPQLNKEIRRHNSRNFGLVHKSAPTDERNRRAQPYAATRLVKVIGVRCYIS